MSRYAQHTTVPVERSRAEIETLLQRYGADQFSSGWREGEARVQFRMHERYVRFSLPLPDPRAEEFTSYEVRRRYTYKRQRSAQAAQTVYERAVRQRWRALVLVVKAKLEAVETGITTFEEEFMAHIIMPDGRTVGEHALPQIAEVYRTGKVAGLLPGW